jgi:CHASE2 domain-containing sensor protein
LRRSINLALALALTGAGAFSLCYLLFFSYGWKGWMIMGSALVLLLGLGWLWEDYIKATPDDAPR